MTPPSAPEKAPIPIAFQNAVGCQDCPESHVDIVYVVPDNAAPITAPAMIGTNQAISPLGSMYFSGLFKQ